MAIDRWLLHQHQLGLHPPTLRFYTWQPAAISLGYHQHQYPQVWQSLTCGGKPLELVRRPSGGRAVLHQGDLTYAVIASGLSGNRKQVYQRLCEFLLVGWRSLGIELHYGVAGRGYIHNPNCFGTATAADLTLSNGRKLIGSAQLYRGTAVLQHGSMQLDPDPALFQQVFDTEIQPVNWGRSGTALHEWVIAALTAAACACYGIHLQTQPLSELEWQAVQSVASEAY